MTRDSMEYDVVIVGAGPAGLSAAIRLKQLAAEKQFEVSVTIVEKGSEVGAHILSGAVFETLVLDELIPKWKEKKAPLNTPVTSDKFLFLTKSGAFKLPNFLLPPQMQNQGNYIISLGNLCRWLGKEAEELGVEIYPGFAAKEILFDEDGSVKGIATGDMGIAKDGSRKSSFEPGVELHAKYTLFAEGARGSLSQELMDIYQLRINAEPQTYGIGIKELWQIDPTKHKAGLVQHSFGWPLDKKTYGGTFLYHLEKDLVAIGMVVALDYANPHLSPFDEFQRIKTHPAIANHIEGGKRLAYGARAINEGGLQSIPKLVFPGGALIGCSAGFLNVPKIKGSHNAMKSGMLAADAVINAIEKKASGNKVLTQYEANMRKSRVYKELKEARNCRPSFRWGLFAGTLISGFELWTRGLMPWTLRHHHDHTQLRTAAKSKRIDYPKPDGKLTFDKLSSVFMSNTNHDEDQPSHLNLRDETLPIKHNLALYDAPEQRYCPAGVYEVVTPDDTDPYLQINAQNCVHCKTCDIKDPKQNILWTVPEGGGGPNYPSM